MTDNEYMYRCLHLSMKSYCYGEIPVGSIIVKDNEIIGEGFNKIENENNPTAHAELIAIENACKKIKSWRLNECTIYTTLEPCMMCSGAIINSRMKKLVFGTKSPLHGCSTLITNKLEVSFGILRDECASLLSQFFFNKRNRQYFTN